MVMMQDQGGSLLVLTSNVFIESLNEKFHLLCNLNLQTNNLASVSFCMPCNDTTWEAGGDGL